jgi:hypothetical protein
MKKFQLLFLLLAFCAMLLPAHGSIILLPGNVPQSDENILFNVGSLTQTGNPVEGITNQTGVIVNFLSDEDLTTPSGGQARVEAVDGSFTNYTFSIPGYFYTSYIFNLNTLGNESGTATITATDNFGTDFIFSNQTINQGENFFTVVAQDNQLISSVNVMSTAALEDVRQNRVGGVTAGEAEVIPEPGTYALIAAGLGTLFLVRRRKSA